jgi:hypothetical protein
MRSVEERKEDIDTGKMIKQESFQASRRKKKNKGEAC